MFRSNHTPPLSWLLDDIYERDPRKIAKHLGVSVATLKRWIKADQAPRAVMLALFFESQWGYSLVATTAHNEAMYERQWRKALQASNAELRRRMARLEALAAHGSANEPFAASA